jgi:hypothetical protein
MFFIIQNLFGPSSFQLLSVRLDLFRALRLALNSTTAHVSKVLCFILVSADVSANAFALRRPRGRRLRAPRPLLHYVPSSWRGTLSLYLYFIRTFTKAHFKSLRPRY